MGILGTRFVVRRTLHKYDYPPDKQKAALELIMEQAEAMADEWTG